MDELFRFFSPEARERRGRAAADLGLRLEKYVPPNLRPLVGLLAEGTPTMTLDRAGRASERMLALDRTPMQRVGDFGEMLSETASIAAPMAVANRAGMPVAEAIQEGLLGLSLPAKSAGQAIVDRANQRGPVPTMYSNPLMGGGTSDPTQTGWIFKDVDRSLKTSKLENRRLAGDTSRVEEVPIRQLYATQPTVNPDFATTSSSAGEMPLVVRKGGKMFVQDGHHRLTRQAEGGAQTANVRFIDLDNADTSTPLLDWSPEKTGFVEADEDLLDALFSPSLLAPRNEAEAMAQKILEMRAAGRAGEVTEEMMAAADDQYMYFNTPIPMDEASRMARAETAGFEGGLFHGTGADIVNIDKEKFGLGENLLGKGFYTTSNPKRADIYVPIGTPPLPKGVFQSGNDEYTEGGNILPLMTRSNTEFDARQKTGKENALKIGEAFQNSDFDVEIRDSGDQVFIKSKNNPDLSVYLDSYQDGMITLQKLKDVFGRGNVTEILEEAGFSGLKAPESSGSVTKVNYNPEDVRSRFARFDPEFRHLRNLSAGFGGLGLLSTMPTQEEQY